MKHIIIVLLSLLILPQCKDCREQAIELNNEAFVLMNTHKKDSVKMALPLLKKAVGLWQDYIIGYSNLGKCYMYLGQIDSTIVVNETFATVAKKDQNRYSCYNAIAQCYDIKGDKEKADECYGKALEYAEQSLKSEEVGLPMYVNIALLKKLLGQKDYPEVWDYAKKKFANTVDTVEINFYDDFLKTADREIVVRTLRKDYASQLAQ